MGCPHKSSTHTKGREWAISTNTGMAMSINTYVILEADYGGSSITETLAVC